MELEISPYKYLVDKLRIKCKCKDKRLNLISELTLEIPRLNLLRGFCGWSPDYREVAKKAKNQTWSKFSYLPLCFVKA